MKKLIVTAISVAVTTSAYAMSPVPQHPTNGFVISVLRRLGIGRVRVNGICVARTTIRHARRAHRRCRRWNGGACVGY